MAAASDYTALITSEHSRKPKFSAMVAAVAQCFVDQQNLVNSIYSSFDLDSAIGAQLDIVGLWVGITRQIKTPLNVYFSLDTVGLGLDQGNWQGPFDPSAGLVSLDDATYRTLIRAKIAANSWDGTIPAAASAYANLFGNSSAAATQQSVTAQQFAIGDGATKSFQLSIGGQPLLSVQSSQIYRNDWQGNQFLYPTSRTNLALYSQDIGGTGWSNNSLTVSTGISAPDGSSNAVTLTTTSPNGYSYQGFSFVSGTSYCISVFAKAGTTDTFEIQSFQQIGQAQFQLSGAGIVSNVSGIASNAQVQKLSNGWYRCSAVFTANANGSNNISPCDLISNSASMSFFGAQVELGVTPTSYIQTTASSLSTTDYSIGSTGLVALSTAPLSASIMTWTGVGTPMPPGSFIFIQDGGDMTMTVGVSGAIPSALLRALFSGGYLPLRPEGVLANYVVPSVNNTPLFGMDVTNSYIAGFDSGSWAVAA